MGRLLTRILEDASKSIVLSIVFIFGPLLFVVAGIIVMFLNYPIITIGLGITLVILVRNFLAGKKQKFETSVNERISKINTEHNTAFNFDDGYGVERGLFFDKTNKKFLLLDYKDSNSKFNRVVDFSYITRWQLIFDQKSDGNRVSYLNVAMDLTTNDPSEPLLRIKMPSKPAGDKLNSALSILLNS